MNFYYNPDAAFMTIYAGDSPADALAAARHAGRTCDAIKPAQLEPITPRQALKIVFNDMSENDRLSAWNDYTDATNDPDARIDYYGNAIDYANEINAGDAAGALGTLDNLYHYGAPYYGDYIKWGVYIEVGTLDELISDAETDDFIRWAEDDPRGLHKDLSELLDDFNDAEADAEEWHEHNATDEDEPQSIAEALKSLYGDALTDEKSR